MIGLDTNVVVRFLTHDDPAQTHAAGKLIRSFSADSRGFLSLVVVAELVWVLQDSYDLNKEQIVRVLETLLRSKELLIERADLVAQALRKFIGGNADFTDCLIEQSGHEAECEYTVTFDRRAVSGAGMILLK